jgi:hypothetical protein
VRLVRRRAKAPPPVGVVILIIVGAIISHLRVGDIRGIGSALFMLVLAVVALAVRLLTL